MIYTPVIAIMMILSLPLTAMAEEMTPATFALQAAQTDMFELKAAKIVIEKGTSDEVKKLADEMIKDHHRTTLALSDAAAKDGVNLPSDINKKLQEKIDALKPLEGPALDAAYISTQISVHTNAVDLFEKFSKNGQGSALKSFAVAYYPTIRMHLVRVRSFNVEQ